MSGPSDTELLTRFLASRDEDSFRRLYAAHAGALLLLAARLLGRGGRDAEDVVQEVWLRVADGRAVYERRAAVRTWLCGIVVNCARESVRGAVRASGLPSSLAPPEGGPEARTAPEPQTHDLERAVRELPNGFRQVLVLHDVYGYTHEEIAALLGIEPGTSKSQLARARQRVRERIGSPS